MGPWRTSADARGGPSVASSSADNRAGAIPAHEVTNDWVDLSVVPELYIADRENKRVQVYNLQGRYLRTFGDAFLNSPSGFAQWGDVLVVAELYARLTVVDTEDNLVGYFGADPDAKEGPGWPERPGWPNALADDGHVETPHLPHPDRFNSPTR
jgi:hypothetical protein